MTVNTPATPLPIPRQSYTSTCQPLPSAWDAQYPFTFMSNYTLLSHHFAINTRIPFSLQVADTCYRAQLATAPLLKLNGTPVPYGLYYGPVNVSTAIPDSVTPYTELYYPERKYSPGYTLSSHRALANSPLSVWLPNSTLMQGGDTTALFCYVGGVSMFQPSSHICHLTQTMARFIRPSTSCLRLCAIRSTFFVQRADAHPLGASPVSSSGSILKLEAQSGQTSRRFFKCYWQRHRCMSRHSARMPC